MPLKLQIRCFSYSTATRNLVGYCQAADGHTLVFAIFTDRIGIETAHTFQDHMAITVANY